MFLHQLYWLAVVVFQPETPPVAEMANDKTDSWIRAPVLCPGRRNDWSSYRSGSYNTGW